jgi:TusA-related sulfurtransferase
MPIILTAKKIKKLTVGRVLEVASDDEGIKKICRLGVKRLGMN